MKRFETSRENTLPFTSLCLIIEDVICSAEFYRKIHGLEAEVDDLNNQLRTEEEGLTLV